MSSPLDCEWLEAHLEEGVLVDRRTRDERFNDAFGYMNDTSSNVLSLDCAIVTEEGIVMNGKIVYEWQEGDNRDDVVHTGNEIIVHFAEECKVVWRDGTSKDTTEDE
jgi:hypothetical protein